MRFGSCEASVKVHLGRPLGPDTLHLCQLFFHNLLYCKRKSTRNLLFQSRNEMTVPVKDLHYVSYSKEHHITLVLDHSAP